MHCSFACFTHIYSRFLFFQKGNHLRNFLKNVCCLVQLVFGMSEMRIQEKNSGGKDAEVFGLVSVLLRFQEIYE